VGKIHALALSPDGLQAVAAEESGTVRLWDLASGHPGHGFQAVFGGPIPRPCEGLVLSPDGRLAAPGGDWNGSLPIWEVSSGRELRRLAVASGLVHSVTLSADGLRLAAATRNDSVRVLEVATGKLIQSIDQPHGLAGVTALAFAPDEKTIVSAGTDGTVCCWPLP
jgi:WD40 repeat protein